MYTHEVMNIVNRWLLQQTSRNKFAQSNLGRGPRRGIVAHVRREIPIGHNGAPQIRPPPKKVPLPVDRSQNPTTCMPHP